MMNDSPFPIRARYFVLLWLMPLIYLPGVDQISGLIDPDAGWYWFDLVFNYFFHALFLLLLSLLGAAHKSEFFGMFGRIKKRDLGFALKTTAFVFVFSNASAYALFYPLSFITPSFVTFWYIDLPPVIYNTFGHYPIIPNLLSFVSLVFFAPVIEELVFRGVLLRRWAEKWGVKKAVLISSVLFGIVHPDIVGATAFGAAMCLLALKTKSLWVPMICHAANNFVVWLIEAGYEIHFGPDYKYSLEDFRDEWFIGVICVLIVLIWIFQYRTTATFRELWTFPDD